MRATCLAVLLSACVLDNRLKSDANGPGGGDDSGGSTVDTDTDGDPNPLGEWCNGEDDDGDGQVDEGYPDSDGNGRPDCLDAECPALDVGAADSVTVSEACGAEDAPYGPVTDPWDVVVQWQFTAPARAPNATWSLTAAVIGNLDDDNGDGIISEDDTPEVVVVAMDSLDETTGWVVVLDGLTGEEKWSWGGALATGGVIIADVDADGSPDVVAFYEDARPVALEGNGTVKWYASEAPTVTDFPMITTADLDEDGHPEVVADDLVLDGATGDTLFQLDAPLDNPYRMAAIGDIDQDGDQEILLAGRAFDSDGTLLWRTGETDTYGLWPVLVQADGDDEAEIGFVGQEWTLWEADGTQIYATDYGFPQPGPPCAGDFDGDGDAEVAWPAYDTLVMYELDGTPVWSTAIDDSSGLAGCSGFDVDGDGALEVLYGDQTAFRIFDGRDGSVRYTNSNHRSGTVFEYPTVADIDHDGHAEIVLSSNMYYGGWAMVTAFEHGGDGWPPSGSTWGVHDFAITNIEPSGAVPATPEASWLAYNVYRARVASDSVILPNLVVSITDACVADCTWGPVELALQVANKGGQLVPAGTWLTLYADDGGVLRYVDRWALPVVPAGKSVDGFSVVLSPADIGADGFVAVVDDDGSGIGVVEECDETDNQDAWVDVDCP
jgi:hypothetical protein